MESVGWSKVLHKHACKMLFKIKLTVTTSINSGSRSATLPKTHT